MRVGGKHNVIGVLVDAVDYEGAIDFILTAAHAKRPAAISALAVHGVMTGVLNPQHRFRLNSFELLVPDGQPVRWVLNLLYKTNLKQRVYGPQLTVNVCERAAKEGLSVYLYGTTKETLDGLRLALNERFPKLEIAGSEPSKFRRLTPQEKAEVAERISASGASITLVGLGCPRQEVFAYEFREALSMPIMAVGAAFPFISGNLATAPSWMQERGLEWLFRLSKEPNRLWRRYILLNPAYAFLVTLQSVRVKAFPTYGVSPVREELFG